MDFLHSSPFSKSEIAANASHKSNFQLAQDPSELLIMPEVLMGNNCSVMGGGHTPVVKPAHVLPTEIMWKLPAL